MASLTGPATPEAPRIAPAATPGASTCDVYTASYGGRVALLIRSVSGPAINYTVLQVDEGFEQPQADAFIATHAPNGRTIARFPSPDPAFVRAFELCPGR